MPSSAEGETEPTFGIAPDPQSRLNQTFAESNHPAARGVVKPLQRFLHTEASGGLVLVAAAILALFWANSAWSESYEAFIHHHVVIDLGFIKLDESFTHWVNDLLMAVFFFVAGLEIKRELVHGDLRDPRRAALPISAAIGGMIIPALIYVAINFGGPNVHGWGIPMATDIAFALGILALVGDRAAPSLKVFLLTLAIVDDIGAIIVIALFYTAELHVSWLILALGIAVLIVVLQRIKVYSIAPYFILAALMWLSVFESGVHATIAGVLLGLLTPAWPLHPPEAVTGTIHQRVRKLDARPPDGRADEEEQNTLESVASLAREGVSPLRLWEHRLHPWSAFVILPLFALVNAGVPLNFGELGSLVTEPVPLGVIVGLVVGKPIGVLGACVITVALGLAKLPRGVGWIEMAGIGLLAGVGFTVSIFISGLAFTSEETVELAKVGILCASLLAGIIGYIALVARSVKLEEDETEKEGNKE